MDVSQAKHAFITGGASGIGLGIADAFLKRGVPVTIVDIDADSIAAVLEQRQGMRGQALDVRDREAWKKAKAEAEAAFGPVDILVANAGIGPDGADIPEADPNAFDRIFAVNVGGIFNAVSAFAGDMRARKRGHIVITGSMAGLAAQPVPRIGTYSASKSAVVALGEFLRFEMAPFDVGVSTLCPGMVSTNLGRNAKNMGVRVRSLDLEEGVRPPIGAAMDPAQVGEITIDGIARNAAYIITHPEDWPTVEARFEALKAAFGRS